MLASLPGWAEAWECERGNGTGNEAIKYTASLVPKMGQKNASFVPGMSKGRGMRAWEKAWKRGYYIEC